MRRENPDDPWLAPAGLADPATDFDAERRRLAGTLRRSVLLTALLLGVMGGLAGWAVRQTVVARERLGRSLLDQARSARVGGRLGGRAEALSVLGEAARHRAGAELRDEAIMVLAMEDLEPGPFTNLIAGLDTAFAVGAGLDRVALAEPGGGIRVRGLWGGVVGSWDLPGSGEPVHYLFFSPDDRWLVARYESGRLVAWSMVDGQPGWQLGDLARVTTSRGTVRFVPGRSGWCWVSDQGRRRVRLLDLDQRREVGTLDVGGVPGVWAVSEEGRVAVGVGAEVQVWDVGEGEGEGGRCVRESFPSVVSALAWQPGGRWLAVGGEGGQLELRKVGLRTRRVLVGHRSLVNTVGFDPTGRRLFSTSWDGTTRFWEVASGRSGWVTRDGLALHYDRSGSRLGFYRGNNGVGVWKVVRSPVLQVLDAPDAAEHHMTDVAASPDGVWVAGVNRERLMIWDRRTGGLRIHRLLAGSEGVAWSPDGQGLLTTSSRGVTRWGFRPEAEGFAVVAVVGGEGGQVAANGRVHRVAPGRVVVSADGSLWAGAPWEGGGAWRRWDAPDFNTHAHATAAPDGSWVLSQWKGRGTWRVGRGGTMEMLEPVGGFARFSPDGRHLLTGNNRGYRVWWADGWREAGVLEQQLGSDFPGLGVFHSGGGGAFLVWEQRRLVAVRVPGLQPMATFESPGGGNVYALDHHAGGDLLVVGTDARQVEVWDLGATRRELGALGIAAWDGSGPGPRGWGMAWGGVVVFGVGVGLVLANLVWQRGLVRDSLRLEGFVTDRNRQLLRAREELFRGHQMRALGGIAAGVAHDLRNLLSVISMSNGLMRRGVAGNPGLEEEAAAVENAVERGRGLVRGLMGYGRPAGVGEDSAQVAEVVGEMHRLLGGKVLHGVGVTLDLSPGLPAVCVPRSAVEQILMNLMMNAAEAMQGRGAITVRAGVGTLPAGDGPGGGDGWVRVLGGGTAGPWVCLLVADTGPGMPAEILPRIFEPFFTTKTRSPVPGTGLGLSTVYALADRHGLGLAVRSTPGRTEFVLALPVVVSG